MTTHHTLKDDVDRTLERLATLRDDVRVRLHLASLDAKTEWDEKLSPRIFEVEQAAKHFTEATREAAKELVGRLEAFLAHLRERERDEGPRSAPPQS